MTDLRKRLDTLEQRLTPTRPTMACYQLNHQGDATLLWGDPSPDANFKVFLAAPDEPDSLPPTNED